MLVQEFGRLAHGTLMVGSLYGRGPRGMLEQVLEPFAAHASQDRHALH